MLHAPHAPHTACSTHLRSLHRLACYRPLRHLACYHPLGASPLTAALVASPATNHSGVVVVPYTKSAMSFFELYRMNVPLFYPSVALLTKWELGVPTSTPTLTAHTAYTMCMYTFAWSRYSRR